MPNGVKHRANPQPRFRALSATAAGAIAHAARRINLRGIYCSRLSMLPPRRQRIFFRAKQRLYVPAAQDKRHAMFASRGCLALCAGFKQRAGKNDRVSDECHAHIRTVRSR